MSSAAWRGILFCGISQGLTSSHDCDVPRQVGDVFLGKFGLVAAHGGDSREIWRCCKRDDGLDESKGAKLQESWLPLFESC